MPGHRRGWGRTYGAGERLPDLDPTPPESDDEPDDLDDEPDDELDTRLAPATESG